MKPAAIFDLVVKSFGVYLLVQAINALSAYFAMAGVERTIQQHFPRAGLLHVIFLAAAAVWFLYGAHPIQDWAYPKSDRGEEGQPPVIPQPQGPFCVSCDKPIPAGAKVCPACGWTQPG